LSSSNTNQTGIETGRPDFLPVTVIVISLDFERRSFKALFTAGIYYSFLERCDAGRPRHGKAEADGREVKLPRAKNRGLPN
jgi:hypothetical protein